ncbi:hypothetical protein ED28_18570 [[Pantoea] beijingensis]|uniref:Uncharacterized protein n=1 Tax=[Pantoea] beijingensis TaxID=1324864 RepID=A0A443I8L6_9GAMM|nr:hypothetical protein ED28_18570 [[Pantoea] beijingensis]
MADIKLTLAQLAASFRQFYVRLHFSLQNAVILCVFSAETGRSVLPLSANHQAQCGIRAIIRQERRNPPGLLWRGLAIQQNKRLLAFLQGTV